MWGGQSDSVDPLQVAQAIVKLVGGLTNESSGRHRPGPGGPSATGGYRPMGSSILNLPDEPMMGVSGASDYLRDRDFRDLGRREESFAGDLGRYDDYWNTSHSGQSATAREQRQDVLEYETRDSYGTREVGYGGSGMRAPMLHSDPGRAGGAGLSFGGQSFSNGRTEGRIPVAMRIGAVGGSGKGKGGDQLFSSGRTEGRGSVAMRIGGMGGSGKGKGGELSLQEKKATMATLWADYRSSDFDGIPPKYLFCRDCHVRTDNGNYFLNHLKGQKHIKKLETDVEENTKKVAKMKEFIKKEQGSRTGGSAAKHHCKLCDTDVLGTLEQHRGKPYHQKLKMFIHPQCGPCGVSFQTRLDWEAHRFLPQHLMTLAQLGMPADTKLQSDQEFEEELGRLQKKHQGKEGETKNGNDAGNVATKAEDATKKRVRSRKTAAQQEVNGAAPKAAKANQHNKPKEAKKEAAADSFSNEALGSLDIFDPAKAVGLEHVVTFKRFMCKACKQYLPTEEEVRTHLKSRPHWEKCVQQQDGQPKTGPPKKSVSAGGAEEVYDPESAAADDEVDVNAENDNDSDVVMEEEEKSPAGKRKKVVVGALAAKKQK